MDSQFDSHFIRSNETGLSFFEPKGCTVLVLENLLDTVLALTDEEKQTFTEELQAVIDKWNKGE